MTRLTLASWQEATGQDQNSQVLTPDQVFQNYSDGIYQLSALSLALGVGYQPVPVAIPTSTSAFQFEFGTTTSPFASGYTAVNESTKYNAALGYGWQRGTVLSRVDSAPGVTTVQGAYDYTTDATFGVDLPDGTYNVTLTMGDTGFLHDLQGVFLQGIQVASVTTQAGQFNIAGFTGTVTNGQLDLELKDLGGSDPNVVINAMTIVPTAAPAPSAASTSSGTSTSSSGSSTVTSAPATTFNFEFGTQTSLVAAGYTSINEATTYNPSLGYGWQSGTVFSRDDTALGLTAVEDAYDYTTNATFAVNLTNGTYKVTVTMGDSGFSHDLQGVFIQGIQVDSVTTSPGQFYTQTYSAVVTSGQLALKLQDLGGNDPNVVINGMNIVPTAAVLVAPAILKFQFGTPTSAVAPGYTAINAGTTYSTTLGYGWQSGAVLSRDDTALALTTLQDSYDYTQNAAFAVNLPNGTYNVTITMGDSGFSHDLQGVFLQGSQVDSVTTNPGQFYTQTYSAIVTDGQLVLKLHDLGGTDPNVVINALAIVQLS
jgi:fibronectin type 3 domain-containing protein